jgi:hypothetical protein
VNPLRALPKPMVYEAQVRQDGQSYDAPVTVLSNTDARLRIDAEVPCHDGPAVIDFIRRAD